MNPTGYLKNASAEQKLNHSLQYQHNKVLLRARKTLAHKNTWQHFPGDKEHFTTRFLFPSQLWSAADNCRQVAVQESIQKSIPPTPQNKQPKQQNKSSTLNLTLNKQIPTPQAPLLLVSVGEEEGLKGSSAVERTAWQVQLTFCSFLVVTILLNCFETPLWKTKMISLNSRYLQYLTILTIT